MKTKNIVKSISVFLLLAFLIPSCKAPVSPDNNEITSEEDTITPGWYMYTTNANSDYPQQTFLYINTSGAIERAGSSAYEYTGSQLEMMQQQLSYTICKKNADGIIITFEPCDAPSWGTVNNETDTSTCPYEEGEYLDIYKQYELQGYVTSVLFYWPINKNLPLWSEGAIEYFVACSEEYGYINENNVFVVGSLLKAEDEIQFSVRIKKDAYNTGIYYCNVKFTDNSDYNNNENNDSGITLDAGYEWW